MPSPLKNFIDYSGEVIPRHFYMHLLRAPDHGYCVFCNQNAPLHQFILVNGMNSYDRELVLDGTVNDDNYKVACNICDECHLEVYEKFGDMCKNIYKYDETETIEWIEGNFFYESKPNKSSGPLDKTVYLQYYINTGLFRHDVNFFTVGNQFEFRCVFCEEVTKTSFASMQVPVGSTNIVCSPVKCCMHCDRQLHYYREKQREYLINSGVYGVWKRQKNLVDIETCSDCGNVYPITIEEKKNRTKEKIDPGYLCQPCARLKYQVRGPRFLNIKCKKCGDPDTLDFLTSTYAPMYSDTYANTFILTCESCIKKRQTEELFNEDVVVDEVTPDSPIKYEEMAEKITEKGNKLWTDVSFVNKDNPKEVCSIFIKTRICQHDKQKKFIGMVFSFERVEPGGKVKKYELIPELSAQGNCSPECGCYVDDIELSNALTEKALEWIEKNKFKRWKIE